MPDGRLVIGLGQSFRQDDGVGPYVARGLSQQGHKAVAHEGDGAALLDIWAGHPYCLVIDAIGNSTPPGRMQLFTDLSDPAFLQAGFLHSTHRIGLPEAVQLGRALDRLPKRLLVIGIVGSDFGYGQGLSAPVATAADALLARLSGKK